MGTCQGWVCSLTDGVVMGDDSGKTLAGLYPRLSFQVASLKDRWLKLDMAESDEIHNCNCLAPLFAGDLVMLPTRLG